MNEDQFKKIIDQALKENTVLVKTSTEKENSNLVFSLKEVFEQRLDEMTEHLVEIKDQVKKTNGRVNSLENHRSYLWGAYTLLAILGGVIITLSIQAIDSKIKEANRESISSPEFQQILDKTVEQALSKYDIEYQPYEER